MARPKKIKDSPVTATRPSEVKLVARQLITPMPADMGREDLNQIAHKINEIINHLNG